MTAWIVVSDCQEALAAKDARIAELKAALNRAEGVLVAADRVREAYEAMLEGRDIGSLSDWTSGIGAGAALPDTEGLE